jgi:hypothetical protein
MTPYLTLLFTTVGIASLGRRFGGLGVRRLNLLFVAGILVFFAGLRDRSIGTDTGNYVGWLNVINSFEQAVAFPIEFGYSLIVLLSGWLSNGYEMLLIITALITVTLYLATIFKLSQRYETALFVFITLGAYSYFFNGARQGIAAAICFFALPWLLERKAIPYLLLILVAMFFHKTALIAAPLFFIAAGRVRWRVFSLLLIGAVVMVMFMSTFVDFAGNFIDEKYALYGLAGAGGGLFNVAFLMAQGFILFIFRKQVNDPHGHYARLLNIYFIGLIPALASVVGGVNPSGMLRLTIYFSHTAILLWPMVFLSFRKTQAKQLISAVFIVVSIAYFFLTTLNFSDLAPYKLNSGIF